MTSYYQFFGQRRVLPEWRWLNWIRLFGVFCGLLVLTVMSFALWFSSPPIFLRILLAVLLPIGAVVLVSTTLFRWAAMKMSARRRMLDVNAPWVILITGAESTGQNGRSYCGPGWILPTQAGLAFWEADSTWAIRAHASEKWLIDAHDIVSSERIEVARGHAYPRLLIKCSRSQIAVAIASPSGRSVTGAQDGDVDAAASKITSLLSRP